MERCTASDAIEVQGSAMKPYVVSFTNPMEPTCTCTAFAIGRNRVKARMANRPTMKNGNQDAWCKHINKLWDTKRCHWRGEQIIPGLHLCPECGGETEPTEGGTVNDLLASF